MARFTVIADNAGSIASFGPYVPAMDATGRVAFTVALRGGGSAVLAGDGGALTTLAASSAELVEIVSHPVLNARGAFTFYARRSSGGTVAMLGGPEGLRALVPDAGPLGPTMNGAGLVALRTQGGAGQEAVWLADGESCRLVADTSRQILGFQGLPVATARGWALVRADLRTGGQALLLGQGGSLMTVADTGGELVEIGRFPSINADGVVAFVGRGRDGREGIFTAAEGEVERHADSEGPFESFRGALIDDAERLVFYATPRGGTLGVYARGQRLFGLGDTRFGAPVVDFALNPVSLNGAGQLATRLKLADGRELIVGVALG